MFRVIVIHTYDPYMFHEYETWSPQTVRVVLQDKTICSKFPQSRVLKVLSSKTRNQQTHHKIRQCRNCKTKIQQGDLFHFHYTTT